MSSWKCRHCEAELSTEGVPSFRACRCSNCGNLNYFSETKDRSYAGQETAWYSFWFGLATALVLLAALAHAFLLEAPWWAGALGLATVPLGACAMYLGIKALLRNRYQKAPMSAKVAAGSATVVGGCGGLFFGGVIGCIYLIGLIVSYSSVETNQPELVLKEAEKYYEIELAETINWIPYEADLNPVINAVEYTDNEKFSDSQTRFYVTWMSAMFSTGPAANNQNQLKTGSKRGILGGDRDKVESYKTRTFDWDINGQPQEVQKIFYKPKDPDELAAEFVIYQCLVLTESKTYALTLLCVSPDGEIGDQRAQAMFESFQPKE